MLFAHCSRRPASRADCTAGNKSPVRVPMMAMTTSNSTRVNALRRGKLRIRHLLSRKVRKGPKSESPEAR